MTPREQLDILRRGTAEIVTEEDLMGKLGLGRSLNVKLGVDPTAPEVHLGFTVVMRKLRAFQELGHKVILIIGDYTATVGDPTGRNRTRPMVAHEQVLENARTYQEQFFKVVNREGTEVLYNGSWFKGLAFDTVTRLMSEITVAQMLEREDFQARHRGGRPINLHEFLYPMMQAYDSVMIKADVELGGTDQKFNILRGRELQKSFGQEPQAGVFMPILPGTDGKEKMSKSLGNTIGIDEPLQSMYHKLYNIPDGLIGQYLTLLTDMPAEEISKKVSGISSGGISPGDVKRELALEVVSQYYGKEKAELARREERRIHMGRAVPDDIPELKARAGESWLPSLMVTAGLAASNGEARRLILNGGVTWDGEKITDPKKNVLLQKEHVLKAGKRRFVKIIAG